MKLIICDKNKLFIKKFKKIIEYFIIEKNIYFEIYTSDSLLNYLKKNIILKHDLVFLGDTLDKVETANHIINENLNFFLVIISNYNSFCMEYLNINYYRYILKSKITIENLGKVINSIYTSYIDNTSHIFITKDSEVLKIKISDIVHISIVNRYVYLKTNDGKEIILKNRTLSELQLDFSKYNFIQTYRAMYVNHKYIKKIIKSSKKLELLLINNEILSVSINKQKQIKDKLSYLLVN